jgi:ATP-dependent DNA helicase 2 subunit 2
VERDYALDVIKINDAGINIEKVCSREVAFRRLTDLSADAFANSSLASPCLRCVPPAWKDIKLLVSYQVLRSFQWSARLPSNSSAFTPVDTPPRQLLHGLPVTHFLFSRKTAPKMAEKEVTVYIVDVSRSMSKSHQGRQQSDLDWALQYIFEKITTTVGTGRKTAMLGVVGLGTDRTQNQMSEEEGYKHISILQSISQILMPDLQRMPGLLKPSNTDDGDALSAIIIAVDMIMKHCKNLKYSKKIVLVTNGTGPIDDDDIESVAKEITNNGIDLVILGVDFDDAEYGFTEENKSQSKAKNERALSALSEKCDGVFGTMQEAIDGLSCPPIKVVRPTPTYKGQLRLGDPENYDTALTIDIERYFKTQLRRAPTASSYTVRPQSSQAEASGLSAIHNEFTYTVKNDNETTGVKHLKREDLAKGYEYGRTAVHISETDENITKLDTSQCYDLIGFIPAENVERYMIVENSNILVPQKGNDKAAFALSSLVHALFELGTVAVARFVKKDGSDPAVTLLSPLVEADFECLVENILPFAEDIRAYRFPPLDKVLTVSGKTLIEHRNLPNDDLLQSMSDFVDEMSLVNDKEEEMAMDDTFSPVLHTVEGAVRYRAIHPDGDIPPKPEAFLAYSRQPEGLRDRSKDALHRLLKAADVKKVPPKVKGRKRYRDVEKPISGLDVEELFRKEKRTKISPDNAIPEFRQALDEPENMDLVKESVKQMGIIIQDQIRTSFGSKNYDRALEGLKVVRGEMLLMEEPTLYNDVLRGLKSKLMADELGGNRREFWWRVRTEGLTLIDKEQLEHSDMSKEEADAWMTSK